MSNFGNSKLSMINQADPLAELPALAARLGVEPLKEGTATVLLTTKDGRSYSLFALVNAALDRLDKVA